MSSNPDLELIPVLRRPRREWQIPAIESYALQVERQEEEARLKALCEGTTPYGREIFRRMLDRAWQLCEKSRQGAILEMEVELSCFAELRREFSLLWRRLHWGTVGAESEELSTTVLAALMVARARLLQRLNREQSAPAEVSG